MVDEWPSRLPIHHPHFPIPHEHEQGVAALAPQFDLAVPSSRRSVPPIGSLSPEGHAFGPSFPPANPKSDPFQMHAVLTPNPQHSHPHHPLLSPSLPAADFLAECNTHSSGHLSQSYPLTSDNPLNASLDFDLFGLASLDLGPPVFHLPSQSTPNLLPRQSESHRHVLDLPQPNSSSQSHDQLPTSHIDIPPSSSSSSYSQSLVSHQSSSHPINPLATSPARPHRETLPHPTRCVLLRNIPPGIDDDEIRCLLQRYGPLRNLGAQQRSRGGRGTVLATYYDLRHARMAVAALDSALHFGRRLDARFQCPTDLSVSPSLTSSLPPFQNPSSSPSTNQGTLVVFNLDTSTSADDIRSLFSKVGDVKEIRATPNKKHHKFVEFYDVRDAERAMHVLNKTEVAGKRIKIEISRPGGRANILTRHSSTPSKVHSSSATAHPHQPRHQSNASHVQYSQEASPYRNSQRHQSMDGLPTAHLHAPLLSCLSQDVQSSSQSNAFPQSSPDVSFDAQAALSPNLVIPSGFDATNALSGSFERPFANNQTGKDLDFSPVHGGFEGVGESSVVQSSADSRASADMHHMYANHGGSGSRFQNGCGMPPQTGTKPAPDSYIQALYNSPSSDDTRDILSPTLDASPRRNTFNGPLKADVGCVDAGNAGLFGRTFSSCLGPANSLHGSLEGGGSSVHHRKLAGSQGSSVHDRTYPQKQTPSKPGAPGSSSSSGANNKPYGNQQLPSNMKYALDIRKVRSGEEIRTALMIRNIPNKYNQKMLLGTLEEGHKGHFDFIYLPIDFKNKCNVGYAFINFTKPQYIESFYDCFHGKKWGRFNSEKVCEITFARIQGRQQLIAHFQNSSLLLEDPKCRPVIFDAKGRQEEFPIGSHVRTRRGPSSRDSSHRACETSPPYSPTKHRGRG